MKSLVLKKSFGLVAKEYQKYRRSYDPKLYSLLSSLLPEQKRNENLMILDIGCGTGKSTEPLLKIRKNIYVFGIDPDLAMLKEARLSAKRRKLPIMYIKGPAEKIPFKKETLDAAISGAAFHWYANKKSLTEIRRVLKPHGLFFVFWAQYTDTDKPTIGNEVYRKYKWQGIPKKFRQRKFVRGLLSQTGFKSIKTAKIPFTEDRTLPQVIGNLKTNSSYAVMSPQQKIGFVREMTQAYKDTMGSKRSIQNKLELLICYGFK